MADLIHREEENAFLHRRMARLAVELSKVRASAPRLDLSGAIRSVRASKVYCKLAATYHPDHGEEFQKN